VTHQARPRISIVVPFRDNADVLGDCLTSIAAQSFGDFEVLMVDDGSTDGGGAVAAAQAAADSRFTLVDAPPGGSPGYARNQGISRATGEYLAFVDGDDMVPAHSLERMLHTLAASGSDFVSGGVERIGPLGITPSYLHGQAIKAGRTGTHISRSPELFFDVSVWNKLFRKSFWDRHNLVFPEGVVWEDLQLMTKAHVLARAVDTIPEPIYYWRERASGELSITQSRTAIANFRDRITAFEVIDEFLRERSGLPRPTARRLVREHQRKALVNDLWLYVPDLGRTTETYRAEFCDRTARYLARTERRVLRRLPSTHKLAYHLIASGRVAELLEYVGWLGEQPVKTIPVVSERGRLRADLPFRDRRDLAIPASVYRPAWRELDPFIRVEGIDWTAGKMVISGCAFVPSVDIRRRRHTSKIVILWPRGQVRLPVVVPARSFRHAEAKRWSAQHRYDYDWAGFAASVSPRWFRLGHHWLTGEWDGYVLVRGRRVWRAARLHTPVPGSAERPAARQVAPGFRLSARWIGRRLRVPLARTPAELRGCELVGGDLVLAVDVQRGVDGRAELMLKRPQGATSKALATTVEPSARSGQPSARSGQPSARSGQPQVGGGHRLRGVAPAGLLDSGGEWDLFVANGPDPIRVAFPVHGGEYR
jgi:CDP-glycerol glycerophosphotransferase